MKFIEGFDEYNPVLLVLVTRSEPHLVGFGDLYNWTQFQVVFRILHSSLLRNYVSFILCITLRHY